MTDTALPDTTVHPTPVPATPPDTTTLTCVFAVCRAGRAEAPAGVSGHTEGGALRTLPAGRLTAVVQHVPAVGFSQEALRERLADRRTLEECARAHHEVVSAVAAVADTVPLPLATLYLDDDRARSALVGNERRFLDVLDRITGRLEWGVKVYTVAPRTRPERSGPPPAASPGPGAGRAYLERLRNRRQERDRFHDAALRTAERVDAAARAVAVAARRLRAHGPEATGKHRSQVLNAAYLVPVGQERRLREALAPYQGTPGVELELSGPWVPYSFTDGSALA
ncbi:GvpL/GvpF family gas vesicle protein [Streptomyces macrosporus]|uniref:GvpL/GvpF family gas vesicle protein n=1 Tax=Streptomyces macrosporus TaxID=44032 RepID=A0ABP5XBV5_9ACTN